MRSVAYITLAFAPVIAAGIFLYFKNRGDKPFSRLLVKSYLVGMAAITVLLLAEIITVWLGLFSTRSLKRSLFFSFITIAGGAEFGKFLFFRLFIIRDKVINKPIHGITFAIMTALGFSTLALPLYALNLFGILGMFPSTLYAFIFVPANIALAVILGFFVGMAKFLKNKYIFSLTGLFGSAFFHGIFNFCLVTDDYKLLSLFSFGFMVIVFILGIKAAFTQAESS
jgi:RsiW-degrading membrane proteinase PrsW (M82 family)